MTLGPALCVLAWMDRPLGPWASRVAVYGRVPLFYYVLHLFLIHAIAIACAWPALGAAAVTTGSPSPGGSAIRFPPCTSSGRAVVLALYPACQWFAAVKRQNRTVWMSFL